MEAGASGGSPKRIIVAVVVIVLVVMVVGTVSVLSPSFPSPQRETTSAPVGGLSTYSVIERSPSGLDLRLTVNTTILTLGQRPSVTIDELNPGSSELNVSSSSRWALPALMFGPCGPVSSPIAVAVVQGFYTASNISKAPPVQYGFMCTTVMGGIAYYSFQPKSDNARVVGSCTPNPCTMEKVNSTSTFTGYWNSGSFTSFTLGEYTVVGGDEWGGLALLNFVVSSTNERPVEVVSVLGPIPPYTPGGPTVRVVLKNVGDVPVSSLSAGLIGVCSGSPAYGDYVPCIFSFDVNKSSPLSPGSSINSTRLLINGGFQGGKNYAIIVNGTLSNGSSFAYTEQVQITAPNTQNISYTLGIALGIEMNTTQLVTGRSINITADVFNFLPRTNNVTGASDWASPIFQEWMKSVPCPFPVYVLILRGYYTQANVSSATPLQISPPGLTVPCPAFLASYYIFQPTSDTASFFGGQVNSPMEAEAVVNGYYLSGQSYNYTLPSGGISPTPFPVGAYTVVAGDEWGQILMAQFSVVSG